MFVLDSSSLRSSSLIPNVSFPRLRRYLLLFLLTISHPSPDAYVRWFFEMLIEYFATRTYLLDIPLWTGIWIRWLDLDSPTIALWCVSNKIEDRSWKIVVKTPVIYAVVS